KTDYKRMKLIAGLARCGQHQRAAEIAEKLRAGTADSELLFEAACGYALCAAAVPGEPGLRRSYTDQALGALQEAVTKGYKDAVWIETDPDLDPIRGLPAYKALMAKLSPQ